MSWAIVGALCPVFTFQRMQRPVGDDMTDKIEIKQTTNTMGKPRWRAVIVDKRGKELWSAQERESLSVAEMDMVVLRQWQKKYADKK